VVECVVKNVGHVRATDPWLVTRVCRWWCLSSGGGYPEEGRVKKGLNLGKIWDKEREKGNSKM